MHHPGHAVLLHGVQSSRLTWWRAQQDLADLGWGVEALDLLGHGARSSAGPADPTIEVLARDVLAQAPAGADLVVGHSLGAIVALTAAGMAPGWARAILLEDPPGLGGALDPGAVARDVERSVAQARADPEAVAAALLAGNPSWSRTDADHAVRSRSQLDVHRVAAMLRTERWDLPSLVAGCPVPVHLLAATSASALDEPDRSVLARLLPAGRNEVIPSGHSIHRDRPALWLHEVIRFAGDVLASS